MLYYNRNDYDVCGKMNLYLNAKDAFMTKGVDNISLFALKNTYYNKLWTQRPDLPYNEYGFLQVLPDCMGFIHGDRSFNSSNWDSYIQKYLMPAGKAERVQALNGVGISNEYAPRCISSNGSHLFAVRTNFTTMTIYKWDMSIPWNVTTIGSATPYSIPEGGTAMSNCYNLCFSLDGTKMYILFDVDGWQPFIKRYDLSTPWDLTTASYISELDLSSKGLYSCRFLNISPDGTSLYVMSSDMTIILYQWKMTAWDITTTSTQYSLDIANTMSGESTYMRFTIDPIFRRMWVSGCGSTGYNIRYYEQ